MPFLPFHSQTHSCADGTQRMILGDGERLEGAKHCENLKIRGLLRMLRGAGGRGRTFDSHSCTNGALGALAWGIGGGELTHILATQTSVQRKPKTMRISLDGRLPPATHAKDLILRL